jgi:hypothetical protein
MLRRIGTARNTLDRAPSAMRIPISRVRCSTPKAIRPAIVHGVISDVRSRAGIQAQNYTGRSPAKT